ncbi:hypothetical protein G4V62_16185 [Bacillaceae bacterium SIJ1]|uniref:hypothetical protein n=1 Tax=Litoribacterium kuwaitense TaxID=1398745 RepID=UPI0013EB6CA7|nr:hypothetical protein [Litoribacterium kuwaitense]NGP46411.1 hypothetical protein [Litoribacterium kuwaitense]
MTKEKLRIPIPDEQTMRTEIEHIISKGMTPQPSFLSQMWTMYHQVGFRYLFLGRLTSVFLLLIGLCLTGSFLVQAMTVRGETDIYAFIFLLSPFVFIVLSLYNYTQLIVNETYELEMTCKYNVFQMIAFRMFSFSILAILFNIVMLFVLMTLTDIQFFRAFMLSMTSLFLFSVLFLYALTKRHALVATIIVTGGWFVGHLFLKAWVSPLYVSVLLALPLYVYALVLCGAIGCFVLYLNRLRLLSTAEGVV